MGCCVEFWGFEAEECKLLIYIYLVTGTDEGQDVARSGELVQAILPMPTAQTIHWQGMDRETCARLINTTTDAMDLRWQWKNSSWTGLASATENVWSRAARRKQSRLAAQSEQKGTQSDEDEDDEEETAALVVKITVEEDQVDVRWVKGRDSVLFESFCGMLKRTLRMPPPP